VAILGGMLLVRCIHVTAKVVCCRHYMQHKAIERLHGRRRSKWRIRRAYFWQRSWLGPTGPLVSICGILHARPRTPPTRHRRGCLCVGCLSHALLLAPSSMYKLTCFMTTPPPLPPSVPPSLSRSLSLSFSRPSPPPPLLSLHTGPSIKNVSRSPPR
jgi:hypothetical protein